jgi:mRNA interferase RelE/StbE
VTYTVVLNDSAIDHLSRLPSRDRARVVARVEALAADPTPPGAKPLSGHLKGYWRLRVGEYRVAYSIDRESRVVEAWCVGPRESFYERARAKRGR